MEEERVIRSRILNQPVHGSQNVLLGGLAHGVLLVVGQDNHILSLVAELFHEVARHIANIVDAAIELAALAKVIDANEQSFPPAVAFRVLETVSLRCAVAERLRLDRWRTRSVRVPVGKGVRVHCGNICAKRCVESDASPLCDPSSVLSCLLTWTGSCSVGVELPAFRQAGRVRRNLARKGD